MVEGAQLFLQLAYRNEKAPKPVEKHIPHKGKIIAHCAHLKKHFPVYPSHLCAHTFDPVGCFIFLL